MICAAVLSISKGFAFCVSFERAHSESSEVFPLSPSSGFIFSSITLSYYATMHLIVNLTLIDSNINIGTQELQKKSEFLVKTAHMPLNFTIGRSVQRANHHCKRLA
jgi:hypothetical protein